MGPSQQSLCGCHHRAFQDLLKAFEDYIDACKKNELTNDPDTATALFGTSVYQDNLLTTSMKLLLKTKEMNLEQRGYLINRKL